MDEFGESFESDSSFDSGMDLGGSESFDSLDSSDMSFTESEPLSEGFDEAPLEDYSSGGEDLSFDETPALEDYSSETAELPFDETPPLEDYTADTAELPFDEAPALEDQSSDMAELPFDEAAPLDDFSSDTEELPFDEVSPLEDPDMVPNDINDELDTLDAVEDDPSAMLDKAPEEDMSYFEDASLETAPESDAAELSEELPLDETVPESAEIPESSDSFEELPFDEAENVPESTEVTDISDETAMPETFEPAAEDGGAETYDFETAPETLDNVDPESSGELAPSDNPYSDAWEQFSEEVNEGDTQQADWDSLKEVPFAGEESTEGTIEEKPYESVAEYMSGHNYGQEDFETYSQDPEWRELMRDEYPDYELPELSQESAKEQLNQYMSDHNYGIGDYNEYSQDPTWRELHSTVFPDDELPPLNEETAETVEPVTDEIEPELETEDTEAAAELNETPEVEETPEVGEWIDEINPNYDPFDLESPYCNNCGSCAYAVYQRLEGDTGICASDENIDYKNEMEALTGMEQVSMSPEEIEQTLLDQGDGAHAIIGIDRAEGSGHWFNAANMGGKVVAIDGQTGEITDWPPDYGDVVNWDMSIKKEDM